MNNTWAGIVTILVAIIGVATLAVLVSKQANTAGVIRAGTGGFADMLRAATSPLSGGYSNVGLGGFQGFSN